MMKPFFLLCMLLLVGPLLAQVEPLTPKIIPQPYALEVKPGQFILDKYTVVHLQGVNAADVAIFLEFLRQGTGLPLPIVKKRAKRAIVFALDMELAVPSEEGYVLEITDRQVLLKAPSTKGLFYASQTLRQLLPTGVEEGIVEKPVIALPLLSVQDYPRFSWRGYMQDVSRTFYGVDVLKKYIDVLALYKINMLHLHLSDDQGWRIAIKKYPELTSAKTTVFEARHGQPAERSGFYTQEQMKDLIAYAQLRQITIVPEIDVPGHCWPIILTHPELGTNKQVTPDFVFPFNDSWSYWGAQFTPNPLDPTKEEVYAFLDDVFGELIDLFPSKYIHFGGDEVVHRLWEEEPHIKAFMKKARMTKVEELQRYFVGRVAAMISKRGRIPIGWNDILAAPDELPKSTTIMSWLGADAVKQAATNNFDVVATPAYPLYFDITQQDRHDGTMADLNYGGANSLMQVYHYDPHQGLKEEEKKHVLGVQANMWPAVPQEVKDVNVQNFPRLLALAEIAWTAEDKKDQRNFLTRLEAHYPRLDALRIDYFTPGGYIIAHWQPKQLDTGYRTMRWDVTEQVYASGRAQAGFFYTKGDAYLNVKNVRLFLDDELIAADDHFSLADKFRGIPFKKDMFFYSLAVDNYQPNKKYTLEADVAGAGSNNSWGNVTFSLAPYQPFTKRAPYQKSKKE